MGYGSGHVLVTLFWILVLVGVAYAVWRKPGRGGSPEAPESALDILKKRYARGEISKAEFEEKKKEIG